MNKTLKFGLILLFIFQLIIAASFGLAHDEAYYWLFSKNLDWGYFDHPPLVAVVISFFSFLPHHEISVRLGFILLQFGTLIFLFRLIDKKFWWICTLIFFSFPLASYSGLLALPDMPLLFMTAAYFFFLKRYLNEEKGSTLALGLVIALLLYAKYHGILLVFFTIVALPKLVLRKSFWAVALISIILFMPHLYWQWSHEFMTLRYHFIERPSSSFSVKRILDYIGTQLVLAGLFAGPLICWQLLKEKSKNSFERVLLFTFWGLLGFFLISTFSKKVEANWTISLVVPAAILMSSSALWEKKWALRTLVTSFAIVVLARIVFVIPGLPIKRLAEFHGWKNWSEEVSNQCQGQPIVANSYQLASKFSFYLNQEISALNYRSRKNQFDLWRKYPQGEVCYITDKSQFNGEEITSPEKKSFKIVRGLTMENLLSMKADEATRR